MSRIAGDSIVALSMNEATDNTSAATMNTVCPRVRAPVRVLSIVMVGDHSDPALQPDQFRQTGETPYCEPYLSRSSRSALPWAIFSLSTGGIGICSKNFRPASMLANG